MLLYYRLPGLIADIALVFYAIFTLAVFIFGL
jgi:preprotein translocase subunit SecD